MSIHDAIVTAAQSVLAEVLAPELAEKLTADIAARAQADIEAAWGEFTGFGTAKAAAVRSKGTTRTAASGDKGKLGRRVKEVASDASSPEGESGADGLFMAAPET